MEWAIEKLTELGVTRIVPMVAARTSHHLIKAAEARVERWRKIAKEASQQARRVSPPEIAEAVKLEKAMAEAIGARIMLSEVEESVSLKSGAGGNTASAGDGIWSRRRLDEEEVQLFKDHGWLCSHNWDMRFEGQKRRDCRGRRGCGRNLRAVNT